MQLDDGEGHDVIEQMSIRDSENLLRSSYSPVKDSAFDPHMLSPQQNHLQQNVSILQDRNLNLSALSQGNGNADISREVYGNGEFRFTDENINTSDPFRDEDGYNRILVDSPFRASDDQLKEMKEQE